MAKKSKNSLPWITKDGKQVNIRDMEEVHLCNTLAYLKRHPTWRPEFIARLEQEVKRREQVLIEERNKHPKDTIDDLFEQRFV